MPQPHAHGLHSIHCHQFDHRICDICRLTRTPRVPPAHHTRLISPRASTIWPFCTQRRLRFHFGFQYSPAGPSSRGRAIAIASAYMTSWTSLLCPLSYAALALPAPHAPMRAQNPLEFVSSWCISKYTYARIDCIGDTPTPVLGKPSCIVFICCVMLSRHVHMVAIAQLVEHLIVVQKVARSSRVSHPGQTPRFQRFPNRTNPGVFRFGNTG